MNFRYDADSSETREPSLASYTRQLKDRATWHWGGSVLEADGLTVVSLGPPSFVGECCEILDGDGRRHLAEVIGFRGRHVIAMPIDSTQGIRFGDRIMSMETSPTFPIRRNMEGRIFNSIGDPIDDGPSIETLKLWNVDRPSPGPMMRKPIALPLATGVRAIDAMLAVGRGQRIGIFGGSGVGKSTLIGMMARNTDADVTVVGLVGERGREVREFTEEALGEEGRKRAVVIVSTSDESPLLRMRAAMAATAVAESYAAGGKHVLLVLDSATRYAMAAREVGLAAGEPPATKGYTPSVFAKLSKLMERAGNFERGSITAFYTVLMEGDDQQDPIVDAARGLLDGHIVLSRDLASEAWFPPINILDSLSRLMPYVTSANQQKQISMLRRLMATHAKSADLLQIGAYKPGADVELDRAIRMMPGLRSFLEQERTETAPLEETLARLMSLETK